MISGSDNVLINNILIDKSNIITKLYIYSASRLYQM